MTNLAQRTITGIIGVPLMLGLIWWNQYSFAFLFLAISVMAQYEFYSLATTEIIKPQKWMGLICGVILYIAIISLFRSYDTSYYIIEVITGLLLPSFFLVFIFELYRKTTQPFTNIGLTLLGIIYIPFTLALLSRITSMGIETSFHPGTMIGYLLIIWIYDIGAYFGGRWFGKRKLFERISPKKTWEGVFGGTIMAFIMAHFVAMYSTNLSRLDWLVITLIIIIIGTLGDLVKSMFKRSINIKDSGTILPGHGGFIDRFDSLMMTSPFVFSYLILIYKVI